MFVAMFQVSIDTCLQRTYPPLQKQPLGFPDGEHRMRVTIRQIAKRTNVSASTVSRVLNDYPYVDEATRTLVHQAASDLGYPIKNLRTAPRLSRSVLLLVREDGLHNGQETNLTGREFERVVTVGLQSVFEQQGIATRLQRTRMERDEVREYVNDAGVAGLVLLGGVLNQDFLCELRETKLPFVVVGSHVQPLQVDCVMANYLNGMQLAVEHLATAGRKRIGLVNGLASTTSSSEKLKGFRLALALHDLPFTADQVVDSSFDAESGYTQTLQLLRQSPDLDAVAYADDTIALGGLRAIKESGRRVPEDVAITGFYNYELGRFTDPPLTSVQFDIRMVGVIAARRLCMLLEQPDDQAWLAVVPTSLIVRQSAPAK